MVEGVNGLDCNTFQTYLARLERGTTKSFGSEGGLYFLCIKGEQTLGYGQRGFVFTYL